MAGLISRLAAFGLLLPVAGVMLRAAPAYMPGRGYWPWLVVAGLVLLIGAGSLLRHRWAGSQATVGRWARKSKRNSGMASTWQILRTASWLAMRRKAKVLRPSLRRLPWWRRMFVPTRAYATPVARVGWLRIWTPCEDVTLRMGGPRCGKSGEIAGRMVDAAGPVIATSTRTDLIEHTKGCRAKLGPLYVFNPGGVADLPCTITFDPLTGCTDPTTASERAADLIAGGSAAGGDSGERKHWADLARLALSALLHAAAIGEAGMRDVLGWVADPDAGAAEVRQFLRRSTEPSFAAAAEQFLTNNDRTRSSVCSTIMPALAWLTNATACQAAGIGVVDPAGFDVAALLANAGTVYMLGAEEGQTAPLLCALTGHIARQARKLAVLQPSGRLDPPLTLALDEAALIAPVPLDRWTADMGGRNVTIHIGVQSPAQLRQRWGDNGAGAIANNTGTLIIFGGITDPRDLAALVTLVGKREEHTPTYDAAGNLTGYNTARVDVLTEAQIRELPFGKVIIIRRGMPAVIGKVRMAWRRHDVRQAKRAERWAPRLQRLTILTGQLASWSGARTRQAAGRAAPQLRRITGGALTGRPVVGDSTSAGEGSADAA